MTGWRYVDFEIEREPGVRLSARYTSGPQLRYALRLLALIDGAWTTIRLWDNAHGLGEHHVHRYTRAGGKQPPVLLSHPTPGRALAAAFDACKTQWPGILDAYLRS